MNSLFLSTAARLIVALLFVFSVYMLLRGHNEPGGGFIGGLIAASGFVLYAIGFGTAEARRALRVAPQSVAMAGLGIAFAGGIIAAAFGDPLFTGQWLFIGDQESGDYIPISNVLVFDIGVFMVVMGSIITLVFALEEEI